MTVTTTSGTAFTTAEAFRADVRVAIDDDAVRVTSPTAAFTMRRVSAGVRAALGALAAGPVLRADVIAAVPAADRRLLDRFLDHAEHLLVHAVRCGPRELVAWESTAAGAVHTPADVAADARVRLSEFAFCRSRGDALVVESPRSTVRLTVVDPAVGDLVARLGRCQRVDTLVVHGLTTAEAHEVLRHLVGAGLVEMVGADGRLPADTDPTLRQWDFHDLLMHGRVRSGRYDDPFGAVYPHRGRLDPQPAVRPVPDGPAVELHRPTWEELQGRDPSLTTALEGRRSVRSYGATPLTVRQLGEFLYRVGRVRAHHVPGDGGDEAVSRPYPSGGRSYELELWLTVARCAGLASGVYYYDPVAHGLVLVNDDAGDRAAMLDVASRATGSAERPDVLLTATARFQRVSWKYRAIAYATTLRHTGVLYQTMYLVATAMGLAPCGLGNGDADLSARVFGIDYLRESSVGDFLLGSRRPDDVPGGPVPADWHLVNSPEWPVAAAALLP